MRIPKQADLITTTLRRFEGQDDAPQFTYARLTPEEGAWWLGKAADIKTSGSSAEGTDPDGPPQSHTPELVQMFCELFNKQIRAIPNLTFGDDDEPFDREKHLGQVYGEWKVEVGRDIWSRIHGPLTLAEQGN